jgi:hypothetical protein
MDLEKVWKFMKQTPPKWVFKGAGGSTGKVHIVMSSDHELVMLLYKRGHGDALCKSKTKFTERFRRKKPHVDDLCPKCCEMAVRLLDANKAEEGKTVRYMEGRFG